MAKIFLPNFLVIGVEKGGTTWLHTQLKNHPEIFLPATKEVHFFNKYNSNFVEHNYFQSGIEWYAEFFKKCRGEKAVGEVTPMYICDPEARFRIKKTLPDVKLIAILRNPIYRAYSHYWMARYKNHTKLTFREAIEQREPRFIERGLYYKQLKGYFQLFHSTQILIVFYEEVFSNTKFWLSEICRFLEVDPCFYSNSFTEEKVFQSSAYRSPFLLNKQNYLVHQMRKNKLLSTTLNWLKRNGISDKIKRLNTMETPYEKISSEDFNLLQDYYCKDIESLSALLNRQLPFDLEPA